MKEHQQNKNGDYDYFIFVKGILMGNIIFANTDIEPDRKTVEQRHRLMEQIRTLDIKKFFTYRNDNPYNQYKFETSVETHLS